MQQGGIPLSHYTEEGPPVVEFQPLVDPLQQGVVNPHQQGIPMSTEHGIAVKMTEDELAVKMTEDELANIKRQILEWLKRHQLSKLSDQERKDLINHVASLDLHQIPALLTHQWTVKRQLSSMTAAQQVEFLSKLREKSSRDFYLLQSGLQLELNETNVFRVPPMLKRRRNEELSPREEFDVVNREEASIATRKYAPPTKKKPAAEYQRYLRQIDNHRFLLLLLQSPMILEIIFTRQRKMKSAKLSPKPRQKRPWLAWIRSWIVFTGKLRSRATWSKSVSILFLNPPTKIRPKFAKGWPKV